LTLMFVYLLGKFTSIQVIRDADLFHCISLKAIGKVFYETALLSRLSLYIARKIHQNR